MPSSLQKLPELGSPHGSSQGSGRFKATATDRAS
jgi:hypothetical protein